MGCRKRLKVAHVQLLPILSGVQRVSLLEMLGLRDEFDFYLVCKSPGPLTERLEFVTSFYVSSLKRDLSPIMDAVSLIRLFLLFRRNRFDVVHTHSSKTGVLGRLAAKLAGCPKVIHSVHGFAFPAAKSKLVYYLYFVMEWQAKFFTDRIIVLNNEDYNVALDKLGYRPNQILLLKNGVDLEKFKSAARQSVDFNRKFKVIMVGRLWDQKDPETFVRAAIKVCERHSNIVFELVGDGPLYDPLVSLVRDHGLDQSIRFCGWVDEIAECLVGADVFVLPSRWEGMPLAILEAKAVGLPCIVTNIPGNSDLIRPGRDGCLFEVQDHLKLAEYIERYYLDRDLAMEHGREARKFVEESFDLKGRLSAISELYKS